MLLTRQADYAVLCVLQVARQGRSDVAEVARVQRVSPSFLANIVHALAKTGIAVTRRGAGGGISLARPPSAITVLDVVEAVQGPLVLNACGTSPPQCPRIDGCSAYPLFREVQEQLRAALEVTIAELLERQQADEECACARWALDARDADGAGP